MRAVSHGIRIFNYQNAMKMSFDDLLELPNVTRLSFGSSIANILALFQSKLIIDSGSSFSLWARYLGQSDCITYYKQLKCRTLVHRTQGFETESSNADTLSADIIDIIKYKYQIRGENENIY